MYSSCVSGGQINDKFFDRKPGHDRFYALFGTISAFSRVCKTAHHPGLKVWQVFGSEFIVEIYEYIFTSKEKYIIGVMLVAVDIGLSVCIGDFRGSKSGSFDLLTMNY